MAKYCGHIEKINKKSEFGNQMLNRSSDMNNHLKSGYVHNRKFVSQAVKKAYHLFPFRMGNVELF